METFTQPRPMVANPRFAADRAVALGEAKAALEAGALDAPVVDVVRAFMRLPQVFTLQCCYGHFLCGPPGQDERSLEPVPPEYSGPVRYRVAYVAFCLEDSARGRALGEALARLTDVDPAFVQYGSADWFWERWLDSYALQVEPDEHRGKDQAVLTADEARHTEEVRDRFFDELRGVLTEVARRGDGQKLNGPFHFGMGAAIGIGGVLGLVLGGMLDNVAVGLAAGAGLGAVAGAILESRRSR